MVQSKLSNFINIEYLGEGSQATVFAATHQTTNKNVAVKMFPASDLGCLREIRLLKMIQKLKLKHSMQYIETFCEKDKLFVVNELIKGQELHDYLLDNKIVSYNALKTLCKKILVAVNELHENNICHLDLKLENIMVDEKSEAVKLIDFGFAELTSDESNQEKERMLNKYRGSIHYSAPEIVKNVPYDGKKADIWSLGVLFYILIAKQFPFPGEDTSDVASQILRNPITFSRQFQPQMIQLIESMTIRDPTKRPSIKYLLQLPLFN